MKNTYPMWTRHKFLGLVTVFMVLQTVLFALVAESAMHIQVSSILLHQSFLTSFSELKRSLDRLLDVFYVGPSPPEALPTYALFIDPAELQKIDTALQNMHSTYLDESFDVWADGNLQSDGETFRVKIRPRGLASNHWAHEKKSWRVRIIGDRLFHGMREMDLILPGDRAWFGTMLNDYRAEKFSLLHLPKRHVTISFNGIGPLLYLEVEHWSSDMLEKQGAPGDVNLYQGDAIQPGFNDFYPAFQDSAYWSKYTRFSAAPSRIFPGGPRRRRKPG